MRCKPEGTDSKGITAGEQNRCGAGGEQHGRGTENPPGPLPLCTREHPRRSLSFPAFI
jgi:hypothetical protein